MGSKKLTKAGVVLAVVLLAAWLAFVVVFDEDHGAAAGPVIADREANAYATAEVSGTLNREANCLTIDDDVVIWPHDTAWDEGDETVVFGGDFEDAPPARVGEPFSGGGGYHERGGLGWVADEIREAVKSCLAATDSSTVVVAHPSLG